LWGEKDGVRIAFGVALVLAGAALLLQQALIQDDRSSITGDLRQDEPEKNPLKLSGLMGTSMKRLLVTDILIRFCEQIPYAFVVVWCMKVVENPVSAVEFGLLTSIEMATAVLVYVPVAHLADKGNKKPFVVMTFVFFTLFPLVLMYCRSFEWLVLAFVVRGLKEFGEPTRKSLIMDLAPDPYKAGMFGLYYLIRDVFVSVAAFGGALLWQVSPETNFVAAFLFGVAGTLGFLIYGKDIEEIPALR
jgi:MFS family permease